MNNNSESSALALLLFELPNETKRIFTSDLLERGFCICSTDLKSKKTGGKETNNSRIEVTKERDRVSQEVGLDVALKMRISFKDKILHPVTDIKYLRKQYKIVDYVKTNYDKFEFLRKKFKTIKDIEHLYRKIIFNKISPNALFHFNQNLHTIIEINDINHAVFALIIAMLIV